MIITIFDSKESAQRRIDDRSYKSLIQPIKHGYLTIYESEKSLISHGTKKGWRMVWHASPDLPMRYQRDTLQTGWDTYAV